MEKESRTGKDEVQGGEMREGKTRDVNLLPVVLDRRCKWTVGGIDRWVVEGEVMEEGGNRLVDVVLLQIPSSNSLGFQQFFARN